ncbi:MAG TPA: CHASE3 domain-containing protein [Burkholderiales bacterium]|nr:CHASE3 domain-containing protein [Burkholderiales bacterium]
MSAPSGRIPVIAFGAALAILATMSAVSYRSLEGFVDRAQWVDHSQEVLRTAEAILSDLKDVETGVRGYLISGDDAFLAPYTQALAQIPGRLAHLRQLTADNAVQQKAVQELHGQIDKRLQQTADFLGMSGSLHAAVPDKVKAHISASKATMDRIRNIADEMRLREEALLLERARDSRRSAAAATTIIVAGTVTSVAMLVLAFVVLRREIDQRARAEHAAQAAAAETESLYNGAPCGYHSVDKDGYFVRINDTELNWLGYSREELIGRKKFIDIVAPAYRQTVLDNFPRLVQGGDTTNLEYELVRKDGRTFPVSVNALPLLDANGNFLMSRTTMFDISALRDARTRLEHANVFLDAVVENIPSMIFVKEAQTLRFARINRAEEKLLGMSREALIGKSDHDLFPREQADFFVAKDREVLAQQGIVDIPEEILTTPETTLILRTRKIGLRDASGEPQYLLGISEDITEQKRAEEAIRALNANLEMRANQLEAANKELESFTYSVSHDLRAPLRAIDGFSRIFEEDYGQQFDDEGRRLLAVIRENSQRMGMLIDDLLAFSRLGRQALSIQPVDMTALANASLADALTSGGAGPRPEIAVAALPGAMGDPVLLKQVWINLLSNAVKYSGKRDAPRVEVGFRQRTDEDEFVTYFVKDNGVGFDMRYYDKLFGVFQRLHRIEEFAGTGVGLAIVHRLVTRHGGRVWAEAEIDKGATFYFTLPAGGELERI